jgi:hypothetical protein
LTLLDDVCNFPKGTDDKFLQKLGETFGSHPHFAVAGPNDFTIKHYAGDVNYFSLLLLLLFFKSQNNNFIIFLFILGNISHLGIL